MKLLFTFILIISMFGCTNTRVQYWCGDKPCKNKKEKEEYFAKTMIVEARVKNKKQKKSTDMTSLIMKENSIEEKKIEKNDFNEKKLLKEELALKEEAKLQEEQRIKEELALKEEAKLQEEQRIKEKRKKSSKKENADVAKSQLLENGNNKNEFAFLKESISKKNSVKPYPDLNDIPN